MKKLTRFEKIAKYFELQSIEKSLKIKNDSINWKAMIKIIKTVK